MKVEKKSDIYFVTNEEGGPFYIQWKNILIYYDDEVPMIEMGTTSKTINTNNFKRPTLMPEILRDITENEENIKNLQQLLQKLRNEFGITFLPPIENKWVRRD